MEMTQLPKNPTALDFIKFMQWVWDGADNETYHLLHHARRTARLIGAKRTGGTMIDGEPADVFQLPCGEKVRITARGSAIDFVQRTVEPRRA